MACIVEIIDHLKKTSDSEEELQENLFFECEKFIVRKSQDKYQHWTCPVDFEDVTLDDIDETCLLITDDTDEYLFIEDNEESI
jgi:hypothetical protein